MKVNLRKIGAVVGGASLLAASAFAASLYFGNTPLVDSEGNVQAKVVVGADAAASDGVAAAWIAAKLAQEAYRTKTYQVKVLDGFTKEGTGVAAGAITNKKVKLEIVTTERVATADSYPFYTLIGDYVDSDVGDRNRGDAKDQLTETDDTKEDYNPFYYFDGTSVKLPAGTTKKALLKVSGSDFAALYSGDIYGKGVTYGEEENVYISGAVKYSSSIGDAGEPGSHLYFKPELIAYEVKFTGENGDKAGIPVCANYTTIYNETKHLYGDPDDKYYGAGVCDESDDDHIRQKQVKIRFLGEEWLISSMEDPAVAGGNLSIANITGQGDSARVEGGSLSLTKVAAEKTVTSSLDAGGDMSNSCLMLDNKAICAEAFQQGNVAGNNAVLIKVYDISNGWENRTAISDAVLFYSGDKKEITAGSEKIKVEVSDVFVSYAGAVQANIRAIGEEFTLESGSTLETASGEESEWRVKLFWKDKDYSNATHAVVDSLRSIVLWKSSFDSDDYIGEGDDKSKVEVGEAVKVIDVNPIYQVRLSGLDLDTGDYDTLFFQKGQETTFGSYKAFDYIYLKSGDAKLENDDIDEEGYEAYIDTRFAKVYVKTASGDWESSSGEEWTGANSGASFNEGNFDKTFTFKFAPLGDNGNITVAIDADVDTNIDLAVSDGEIGEDYSGYVVLTDDSSNKYVYRLKNGKVTAGNNDDSDYTSFDFKIKNNHVVYFKDGKVYFADDSGEDYTPTNGVYDTSATADGNVYGSVDDALIVSGGSPVDASNVYICVDKTSGAPSTTVNIVKGVINASSSLTGTLALTEVSDDGTSVACTNTTIGNLIELGSDGTNYYYAVNVSNYTANQEGASASAFFNPVKAYATITINEEADEEDNPLITSMRFYYNASKNYNEGGEFGADTDFDYDKIEFLGLNAFGYTNGTAYSVDDFVSPRGSYVSSSSESDYTFKIARRPGKVYLEFATANATETTAERTVPVELSEGEETSIGGATVRVAAITADVVGGEGNCTVEVTADDILPHVTIVDEADTDVGKEVTVKELKSLDVDAISSLVQVASADNLEEILSNSPIIAVGGPKVNPVTAEVYAGEDFTADFENGKNYVVTEKGTEGGAKVIVVAGWEAEDTLEAAKEFINSLVSQ